MNRYEEIYLIVQELLKEAKKINEKVEKLIDVIEEDISNNVDDGK